MKTLLFMRHAKARQDEDVSDHDRALNGRGERAAAEMGRALVEAGVAPDLIVSSTALRARSTAFAVAAALGWSPEVRLRRSLYMAEPRAILREAAALPDEHVCVLLVGHNPGMEELVSELAARRESMPTAAIASFSFDVERWSEVERAPARLSGLSRPSE